MSYFFTNDARQKLFDTPALFTNKTLSLVFFREAPVFENNDSRYVTAVTIADLTENLGWVSAGAAPVPLTTTVTLSDDGNNYVRYARTPFTALTAPVEVKAMAVLDGTEIVFVTTTPFLETVMISPQDGLTSNPDIAPIFTPPPADSYNRWLFSWADAPTGGTTVVSVIEGPLAISQGPPPFEASHTQHVWLYPQRTNFIANPSFEAGAVLTGYWSSNGTSTRVSLPQPNAVSGAWAGKFSRALGTVSFHTGSSFIWTPDSPELDIPSDLCVVAKVTLDDWTPPVSNTIVSKHNSIDGQRSWALVVNSSGFLSLLWSSTGSGTNNVLASTSLGMTDGGTTWVGLSIKCSESGSMWARFWKSPDGAAWTLVNTASTSPIAGFFNTAAPLAIGGHTTGTQPLRGTVHHVSVRSGIGPGVNGGTIGGTEVFRYEGTPPGTSSDSGTTFPSSTGQIMTIYGPNAVVTDPPTLVVESNVFPTYRAEQWTVQLRARGDGNLKVGFVWWDDDFTSTAVDWGVETWSLGSGSFTHISICRTAVETYQGMLRLEFDGTEITIDQVLVERGFLKDWDYFDGDSRYGERDDYSWYGGETRKGQSYSMWYNNYKAVHGRMFARETDDLSKITDEDLEQYGYVYKWIPSGTVVIPHSGVLHEGDSVATVIAKDPTSVLSYKASDTDVMGIDNPWL